MHYLQGNFDSALGSIITHLVPAHKYISVYDLFNPQLFYNCFAITIANIHELSRLSDAVSAHQMLRDGENKSQASFSELRMQNFSHIAQSLTQAHEGLGLPPIKITRESLFRLVKEQDLNELQVLLQFFFDVLIRNHDLVQFITTLSEEDQMSIKDFLQRAKARQQIHESQQKMIDQHQDQKRKLQEQNEELRTIIINKDSELENSQNIIRQLQQQLFEVTQADQKKQIDIDCLKKRLIAYQETDSLFQQKDQEIFKLQRLYGQLQVSSRLLMNELKNDRQKWQNKNSELQRINTDLQAKYDKLVTSFELLNRQKEDSQSSNKRVISNLRDRNKSLTDRVNQLQGQLVEAKIAKQLRDRQYAELLANFDSLKSQKNDASIRSREQSMDRLIIGSSSGNGKDFLRLEEQLNEIDKLKQNAFQEQIMMFDSGEDNLKKVQQILAQNVRLKERLNSQQSRAIRQMRQQNERLRKKIGIMKKRNQDMQSQKREQLQLMISVFENAIRLKQ